MSKQRQVRIVVAAICSILGLAGCTAASPWRSIPHGVFLDQSDLFVSGTEGYHTYRIPSLIVTTKGAMLAFCEGRKKGGGDSGDIDLVMRRSTDGGRTWGPMQVIGDDGTCTVGNPCPVVDRATGRILLLLTKNLGEDTEREIVAGTAKGTRTVWLMQSDDDGVTWSVPVNITASAKRADWTWYATGPGCGIQLRSGRLVIPCDHMLSEPRGTGRSHVICSDDRGKSWRIGGIVGDKVNECQVAERPDGTLLINMRNHAGPKGEPQHRAVATSSDGGETWSAISFDAALVEPVCQASLISFGNSLVFANPASTKREKMMVRLSEDGGRTWPVGRVLHEGPSAYSSLAGLGDRAIACFYERGDRKPYERITLARFSREWLRASAPGGR